MKRPWPAYRVILVTGDRHYLRRELVEQTMRDFVRYNAEQGYRTAFVQGGAMGADLQCDEAAKRNGWPVFECPAGWDFYKKAAGPIRNRWMAHIMDPWLVLGFHDDIANSSGTADMLAVAEHCGIDYALVPAPQYDEDPATAGRALEGGRTDG